MPTAQNEERVILILPTLLYVNDQHLRMSTLVQCCQHARTKVFVDVNSFAISNEPDSLFMEGALDRMNEKLDFSMV